MTTRQLVNLTQRDPQWASQRLGTVNGATIGQYGCYVTSMAILANYYGHNITPAQLDDDFTNKGLYVSGDLVSDNDLARDFLDITFVGVNDYANSPADLGHLHDLLSDPTVSVILEVDFDHDPNDGIQTHFLVANACDGTTVEVTDPWYGGTYNFTDHYGANPTQTILKFTIYKGNPVAGGGNMYKGYDLTNTDSMKIAVDILVRVQQGQFVDRTEVDKICSKLGITAGSTVDAINNSINDLQKGKSDAEAAATKDDLTVTNLNEQIAQLKQEAAEAKAVATELQGELTKAQTVSTNIDGQDYKSLYLQAEKDLKDKAEALNLLQNKYNQTVAQYQNTSYKAVPRSALFKEIFGRFFN